jgi:hypothetical protein
MIILLFSEEVILTRVTTGTVSVTKKSSINVNYLKIWIPFTGVINVLTMKIWVLSVRLILMLSKTIQLELLISGTVILMNLLVTLLVVWLFTSKVLVGELYVKMINLCPQDYSNF